MFSSTFAQTIDDKLLLGKWLCVKETYAGEGTEADITFNTQPATEKTVLEFQPEGQLLLHTLRKTSSYSDTSQYQLLQTRLTLENKLIISQQRIEKTTPDSLQILDLDSRPINLQKEGTNIIRYRQVFLRQPDTLTIQIKNPALSYLTEDFLIVEEMPSFPKGQNALMKYLGEEVKFPKTARRENAQGTVLVMFTISSTGDIVNGKIFYSPRLDFAIEVVRVIKRMPRWTPGKQNGEPVAVKYILPIRFRY